jgi:Zn-finger nucleic acid-binding protein
MHTCPRCGTPLAATSYEGIDLETCGRCQGRWLYADDLKALVDTPSDHTAFTEDGAGRQAPGFGGPPAAERGYLACPACGAAMEHVNYAGDSGTLIDRCPGCGGIWLDAGELEKAREAVQASRRGLDRDIKRFSGDLHEVEVLEDALEQQDNRATHAPLVSAIANRIQVEQDPNP